MSAARVEHQKSKVKTAHSRGDAGERPEVPCGATRANDGQGLMSMHRPSIPWKGRPREADPIEILIIASSMLGRCIFVWSLVSVRIRSWPGFWLDRFFLLLLASSS